MTCDECLSIGMPEELCSENKPEPVPFQPDELIFRRHNQLGSEVDLKSLTESQIGNTIFKLENDSYNRSSLSSSEQVLLNEFQSETRNLNYFKDWGIITLPVSTVNQISNTVIINNIPQIATLQVVHRVTPCNYSHSEVLFYLNGELYNGKAPKSARPYFRKQLQSNLTLIKEFKGQN